MTYAGFATHNVCARIVSDPNVHVLGTGTDEKLISDEAKKINEILERNVPMWPLTNAERAAYDAMTIYRNCKSEFEPNE